MNMKNMSTKPLMNNDYEAQQPMSMGMDGEEKEEYPCGLCITLDNESLAKLGIDELPEIGEEMSFSIKTKVKSSMEHEDETSEHKCLTLQITDMGYSKPRKSAASVLYDKKDD